MIIPYQKLSPEALRGVIEEIVTRDGTELSDAEDKIRQVLRLLEKAKLVLVYDPETRGCSLVPPDAVPES